MVWIRMSVTVPKASSTPAERQAAHDLANGILAAQPAGALLGSQFFTVADTSGTNQWQTFGVSVTIWDTQQHSQQAHQDLVASHNDPVFTTAIAHSRTMPPFKA